MFVHKDNVGQVVEDIKKFKNKNVHKLVNKDNPYLKESIEGVNDTVLWLEVQGEHKPNRDDSVKPLFFSIDKEVFEGVKSLFCNQ